MKKLKVGIIGYGLSGRIFNGAILQGLEEFEIKTIVTKDPVKIAQIKSDLGDIQVVEEPAMLFEDAEIDLVIISTPNATHAALAESALCAGKHVVIEKPFTVTSQEAVTLMQIAREAGKVLTVYHNRRLDSDFQTVKKCIEEGRLGRLVAMESSFNRFRPDFKPSAWREKALPGSGILYDLGAHLIDQTLHLFGLPLEIYGDIEAQRQGDTDDAFTLHLYYEGLKVVLKASMLVKEELPRFVLQGTKGSLVKYGLDVQEAALKDGKRPVDDSWGEEPQAQWAILNTISERSAVPSEGGDYRDYYRQLYRAILSGESPLVTAEEGYWVIRLIEMAIQSNVEKRRIAIESLEEANR